ncbi:MAG: hypothetical protein IJ011_06720 [Clostridia bacterium]|nr:hypothetical protein [Clostridia bacterium]
MKFTKIIATASAVLMLLGVLASCNNNKTDTPDNTDTKKDVIDTTKPTETDTQLNDDDTLDDYDFNKETFVILARKSTLDEYYVDPKAEMTSVGREVYARTLSIQDRFNVKIEVQEVNCDDGHRTAYTEMLGNSVNSGVSPYHMLSGHMTVISPQQYNGYLLDLCSLPEFDVKKEWWSEQIYNECNYDGKLYFAVGDIAYTMYAYMQVLFVNESAFTREKVDFDGDISEFYDMVRDGGWTMDKLIQYSTNYASGLTDVSEDEREYGLMLNQHSSRAFVASTEASFEYRNETDELFLYEAPETRMLTLLQQIKDNWVGKNNIHNPNTNGNDSKNSNVIFTEGRGLFYGQELGQAANFDMTDEYGIVPFPMYDEIQDGYRSTIRNSVSAVAVPSNVSSEDHTMIGVLVEAMGMYGYNEITPEYYGKVLSTRLLGDADGQDMLKLVREGFTIDHALANTFGYGGVHPYSVYKSAIFGEKDFTTIWAENYGNLNGLLTTMKTKINAVNTAG